MSNIDEKVVCPNNKTNNNDIISEEQKQKLVEKIINKWLNLQKIIKEEITLEDVIIKQQEDDTDNLKSFFVKYYQAKLNTRKIWNDINKLKLYEKESNILSIIINEELGSSFHEVSEPIKNLFFIIRNNYDYLTRILSLIKPEDFEKNINKVYSLVELLNNNFYENILIPNPDQLELLILIYKLLEEEITSMNSVCSENFLEDNTLIGIFLSSFAKKQEIIGYFSMILNPLILSIDEDDSKEHIDLNINNIINNIDLKQIEKRKIINNEPNINTKINLDINIKEYLFDKIPKTKIKFKNSFELEAEKEKEDEISFDINGDYITDSDKNIIFINKKRKNLLNKNNEYNTEYKYELNQSRLIEKINEENNPSMKNIYFNLLEELNYYPNKFSNEGILKILKKENEKRNTLLQIYKDNFIYIREIIEELLQIIIDKIITMPYSLRCISKFINILISKKFPDLTRYEINSFIGKFIFDKCIFSILSLENKYFIDSRVYNKKTKTCLEIVISILSKAINSSLFDNYSDPEKTIFNPLILEIIPILNEFYKKLIDIQLPNGADGLINKASIHIKDLSSKNLFNFRYKKRKSAKPQSDQGSDDNLQTQSPLYDYFKENPDEILHLQSICFSGDDIKFLLDLIERNMGIFKDLPRFTFFSKTFKKIKNEEKILNSLLEKDKNEKNKTFYIIFREEKKNILEKLIKKKKKDSTFESNEQDSQLICRRIKFCIKTILKGLNLLNSKDFAYLNFAQSTDKFFSAIKYTLEELGEYNELSNNIPLNWYSQYIYNYKKELDIEYQKEDFEKLYSEISTEETNILNDLKNLSNIIITRDGMNLRCAEKILAKAMYELKRIEEAKKYNQLEKFIKTKKIEVCIYQQDENAKSKIKDKDKDFLINIFDIKSCPYGISNNDKNHIHINSINEFIKVFSNDNKIKLKSFIRDAIIKGESKYSISEIIAKYMELVVKKIKENKNIFGELSNEQLDEFSKNIENHIIRKIYKYVYPPNISDIDLQIQNDTRTLGWIQPEHLEIKKLYVNQLKSAEKYISKMNEAKSVFDKLECIQNAFVIMNNTVKFISGKNENAGQDEMTPLFQYIIIKSQPERFYTNINYIKCFLSSTDLISKYGFFVTQMESACTYILHIKASDFKMNEEEFNNKRNEYAKIYENKDINNNGNNNIYKTKT